MLAEERTVEDERVLTNVRLMYRKLIEMNTINAQDGRLLVLVNELCDTQSVLGKLFDEITCEIVVRRGKIFSQLNCLRPKMLHWYKCMHGWKQSQSNADANSLRGRAVERFRVLPYTVWLAGLENYFASEIVGKLMHISTGIRLFFEQNSAPSEIHRHLSDRDHFNNICKEVELELTSELCQSPLMSDALRIIGQFVYVLQKASRLEQYFEPGEGSLMQQQESRSSYRGGTTMSSGTSGSRGHGGGGGAGDKVKICQLVQSYLWLRICIVLSIGSLFQSDALSIHVQRPQEHLHATPTAAASTRRGNSSCTCLSEDELGDAMDALKVLISSQFQLGNALQLLTLRYYKVSCLSVFSAQRKREEMEKTRMAHAASKDGRTQAPLTCREFLSEPLCQLVTVEMPAFIREKLRLSSAHELNEKNLIKTIFVLLMFCDTPEEEVLPTVAPTVAAAAVATTTGTPTPTITTATVRQAGAPVPPPDIDTTLKKSFLCSALIEILRPMVQQLLPLQLTTPSDDTADQPEPQNSGHDAKGQVQLPTKEDMAKALSTSQYEALLALREVANVQTSISITTIRHIQYWSTLGLGPAPNENVCVGEKCFLHAMNKVLGEHLEYAGQYVKSVALPEKEKTHARFLEFLVRTEVAFELLCATGSEFVYQAIRRTYALRVRSSFSTYCSALVLTNALHQYLLVAEKLERARRKKGGGAASAFELRDNVDLFSAVRIMHYLNSKNAEDLYAECCRLRLLYVKKVGSDEKGDLKRACELAVISYWESLGQADDSKHTFELVRGMCEDIHPFQFKRESDDRGADDECRLVTYVLNWRRWDMPPFEDLFSPASKCLRVATRAPPRGCGPSLDGSLPVDASIARAIQMVEEAHSRTAPAEVLCWTTYSQYCRFSMKYPRMDAPILVHGTLLLQQLMVAISQYGSGGVHTAVLAKRADVDVSQLVQILRPGEKMSLIVYTGSEKDVVAMNVGLTALPEKAKSPLVFIPPCSFVTASDAQRREMENVEKLKIKIGWSIMKIMKSKRAIKHEGLTSEVKKEIMKNGNDNVVWEDRLFKQAVGDLIEKKFIERSTDDHSTYVYKA